MTTTESNTRGESPTEKAKREQREREQKAKSDPTNMDALPPILKDMTLAEIEMAKRTIAKDATTEELGFFLAFCKSRGLDPWSKEVYFVKRVNAQAEVSLSFQTSIDGMRIHSRKGDKIQWMEGPFWCGEDGVWLDVWLANEAPKAARYIVKIKTQEKPHIGTALFKEYAQTKFNGGLTAMWEKMSAGQIAKCAEALALRRALPEELGGVHIDDEMQQADNPEKEVKQPTTSTPAPSRSDDLKARLLSSDNGAAKVPNTGDVVPRQEAATAAAPPLQPTPMMQVNGVTAADLAGAPKEEKPAAPAAAAAAPPAEQPTRTGASGGAEGPAMCEKVQADTIRGHLDTLKVTGKEARAAFLGRVLAEVQEKKRGTPKPNPIPPLEKMSTITKADAHELIIALLAEVREKEKAEAGDREPGSDDDVGDEDTGS